MLQFLFSCSGNALTAASMGVFMLSYWLDVRFLHEKSEEKPPL